MRAGIVYIKVPISSIEYEETADDVKMLAQSIKTCGLLQPVGIVQKERGYKLVFGRRRVKACRELNMKYIHAVLLSVREDEEKIFSLNENIHRRNMCLREIADEILRLNNGGVEELLSVSDCRRLKEYLVLSDKAKMYVSENTEQFLDYSRGDSEFFIKMCKLLQNIPEKCSDRVRLSVLSDKRIFINEIEKILALMRQGGYEESVSEDEQQIIIRKQDKAV